MLDGTTALRYSRDPSKTLLLTTKLEDNSSGSETNYNLNVGIKHPYTTVDVEMASRLESTEYSKIASIDVKYLTSDRQTKNVVLMTEINSLKNTLKLEVNN